MNSSTTRRREPEHATQAAFVALCRLWEDRLPGLDLLFAVPNAAKRSNAVRRRMLGEGLKAGVPDLFLPVPADAPFAARSLNVGVEYHGLFLETKVDERLPTAKGPVRYHTKPTRAQREMLTRLAAQGYAVAVYFSATEGLAIVRKYLAGEHVNDPEWVS